MKHICWPRLFIVGLVLLLLGGTTACSSVGTNVGVGSTPKATGAATANAQGVSMSLPRPKATPTAKPGAGTSSTNTNTSNNSAQWSLIYSDDFNGSQLNSTWGVYNGPHGGGQSYYSPSEVQVQNGMLHLWMEKKTTNGLPYTTGGIAAFRLAQTYGKYEFRARLPHGKGVGPYTILWPAASGHGDVEVDLFESPPASKNEVYFTNHGGGHPTQIIASGNFADAFHIFTYEWTPGKLHFLIDGVDQGTLTQNVPNFPMWLGIAVESGDAFVGLPDGTTALPVSLDVDWVHIYKYV